MKRSLLFTFLFSLCLFACTNNEDQIKAVVHKWNELHNTHNAEGFKELYAADVLFYGKQSTKEFCYAKKKAFLSPEFVQNIISPVTISYYSSGTIKCDFTKRTQYRKEKVREYYCYLLVKKESGKYLVTGESDLLSDQRRNTQLALGNKVSKSSNRSGIYIIILLLLLVAGIILWLRKKNKAKATEWETFKEQYKAQALQPENTITEPAINTSSDDELTNKIKAAVLEEMKNYFPKDSSKEKGFLFEKFIVEKFVNPYFKLIEWRSDKFHEGVYATSSKLPDLEYHFKTSRHDCKIAIECKWRAAFKNKKIDIAKEYKLGEYKKYSSKQNIEVFIILGVGGKPQAPEDLYIIPLEEIPGPVVYKDQINPFLRYREKRDFFYNAEKHTLE